jgi:cell division protein FtsB
LQEFGMSGSEVPSPSIWLSLIPAAMVVALLVVAVVGDKGILCAVRSQQEKETLQQQLQLLEMENQKLREDIESLRSDPRYLEAVARKELGMVREDELIYQFRAQKRLGGDSPSPTVSGSSRPR